MLIPLTPLKGHKDSVVSVTTEVNHPSLALSASDDRSCRLWDLRTQTAVRWMSDDSFQALGTARLDPDRLAVYVADGPSMHVFDLRSSDKVLVKGSLMSSNFGADINDFSIANGLLAIPNDDGEVVIADTSLTTQRVLKHHKNLASSAQWRPHAASELITTGYDMQVVRWDAKTGKRRAKLDVSKDIDYKDDTATQLLNPPFVHCARFDPKGQNLVASMGDGSLTWWEYEGGQCSDRVRFDRCEYWKGHNSAVPCVDWAGSEGILVSCGNDMQLSLWNLGASMSSPVHGWRLRSKPNAVEVDQNGLVALVATTGNDIHVLQIS